MRVQSLPTTIQANRVQIYLLVESLIQLEG